MPIHATAVVHPSLELPHDLEVGPYAILDEGITLAAGVRIGPFCHIYPGAILEAGVALEDGVALGNIPQDLKFRGEATGVRVGAGARLREYVTVNRGTAALGLTSIGRGALIMAYAHVAHDCEIGDGAVVANAVQMGGHVRIGTGAVISGMTGIHQFTCIGAGAFVGGNLRVDKDVLPFSKALGDPLRYAGVNAVGLARAGFGEGDSAALKGFYRGFTESGKAEAMAALPALGAGLEAILTDFLGKQKRGLLTRPL